MIRVTNFNATPITFLLLGSELARNIGSGMLAFGVFLACLAVANVGLEPLAIRGAPFAASFCVPFLIGLIVGAIVLDMLVSICLMIFTQIGAHVLFALCATLALILGKVLAVSKSPFAGFIVVILLVGMVVSAGLAVMSLFVSKVIIAALLLLAFGVRSAPCFAVFSRARLALITESVPVLLLARKILARSRLGRFAVAALFKWGGAWGIICHVISSSIASGRAGECYKHSPGISMRFTRVIIPQMEVSR